MRLFQTSRRFQVEIQPQLVLLQNPAQHRGPGPPARPRPGLCGARPSPSWRSGCWISWALQRLWRELKAEAPHYAKILPDLPRLLHDYLRQRPHDNRADLQALLARSSAPTGCCKASSTAPWALCSACWRCRLVVRVHLSEPLPIHFFSSRSFNVLIFMVIAYLFVTIGIGLWAAQRVKNTADFAIAGRNLPMYMIITTTFATWFGSEIVLGVPPSSSGRVECRGRGSVRRRHVPDPVGLFFAAKLYRMTLLTISDYYRERYGRVVESSAR